MSVQVLVVRSNRFIAPINVEVKSYPPATVNPPPSPAAPNRRRGTKLPDVATAPGYGLAWNGDMTSIASTTPLIAIPPKVYSFRPTAFNACP